MELCCGVLLGMGESDAQRLELIGQLAELGPAEVPVNFLDPRPGTPLMIRRPVAPLEAIRWIALFRLGLPGVILRYAGGRELTLGELQAMGMTSGINALIVGNYLTTLGRRPTRTWPCSGTCACRSVRSRGHLMTRDRPGIAPVAGGRCATARPAGVAGALRTAPLLPGLRPAAARG